LFGLPAGNKCIVDKRISILDDYFKELRNKLMVPAEKDILILNNSEDYYNCCKEIIRYNQMPFFIMDYFYDYQEYFRMEGCTLSQYINNKVLPFQQQYETVIGKYHCIPITIPEKLYKFSIAEDLSYDIGKANRSFYLSIIFDGHLGSGNDAQVIECAILTKLRGWIYLPVIEISKSLYLNDIRRFLSSDQAVHEIMHVLQRVFRKNKVADEVTRNYAAISDEIEVQYFYMKCYNYPVINLASASSVFDEILNELVCNTLEEKHNMVDNIIDRLKTEHLNLKLNRYRPEFRKMIERYCDECMDKLKRHK